MRVYIQGLSALAHYRSAEAKMNVERPSRQTLRLANATASATHIREMRTYRLGIGDYSAENPLEVLVPQSGLRGGSNAIRARVWGKPIRGNAFREIDREICVSSPEFVFLQLATRLTFVQLIALGMELCGTYRRNVRVPRLGTDEYDFVTDYHAPVLTTPRRIKGFLGGMKTAPGASKALKALEYVLPNSASPMETVVYLLLCLPRRLGGYALPKPILNPTITFSRSGRRFTLRRLARPDLLWKKERLDLEYNGGEAHDENTRAADSMRRKALEHAKVEVIELTKEEVYSEDMFHATALRLARRLKRILRPEREGSFMAARSALRQELLYEDEPTDASELTNSEDLEFTDGYYFDEEWPGQDFGEEFVEADFTDWDISFEQWTNPDDEGLMVYGAGAFAEK